ncbi:diguanylate cyclase (GGDEF)-like protein [Sphingomonas vulcanisoli]|uniref:diguanylate cyclase n=1 Tax=Sphingomonas vulcanisoli TaxID=1658060 RepID=A0ABX0TM30_9SPHN|nr:GGDEF domain-containing protein [Sphingomonas vulcanisoli]NIJ06571.1 diguanylate cyclase (GGDEF)-like protein [Sphingomonas vulcanisoli]
MIIAAGWGLDGLALTLVGVASVPGVGPGLCWLAAALLFVQGLRLRAKRTDRGMILTTIWAVIAVTTGLLADLFTGQPMLLRIGAPLLVSLGLALSAIAVGPRVHRADLLDWIASGLLLAFAVGNVVADYLGVTGEARLIGMALPLACTLIYAALGLGTMLLLFQDLVIALERLARTDPLTGIWNRRGFNEAAPHLLTRLRRSDGPIQAGVVIADIDAFKSINDRFGHSTGDQVLIAFSKQLASAARPCDLLARLGGEEFALLAIGVSGAALHERIEHLRQIISVNSDADGTLPLITASFGVAEITASTLDLRDALERADRALFRAKELGRNRAILDHMPIHPDSASPVDPAKPAVS